MRICYLDESGVPELLGGTSHFVLLGLSIPARAWRLKDAEISLIKQRFGLANAEVHTGWMARRYLEQERIGGFDALGTADRRAAVEKERIAFLVAKASRRGEQSVREDRKNFRETAPYVHLTLIYHRINRAGGRLVGMRHYTNRDEVYGRRCDCRICADH